MLALVDDVKQFLNKTGNEEDSVLALLLDGVSETIRTGIGHSLEEETVTEVLRSVGLAGIVLGNPVVSITSIKEDTLTLATTDWLREGRTLHRLSDGLITRWGRTDVTVVYRAGFETIPADIKLAAVSQAAFEYKQTKGGGDRLGLSSKAPSQGGDSVGYVPYDLLPGVRATIRRRARL